MDARQRIFLGSIGGITPYLVTLLSIDFKSAVGSYETLDWIGLAVRCLVLMFLGSLVAFLHKSEKEQFKVFQLGLAAPALLATFINGNLGNHQTLPSPIEDDRTAYISLFSRANAAEYINTSMLREPNVSASSRFLRGVFGTKLSTSGDETYFVIVGFHNSKEKALEQVDLLATKRYKAVVYNPDTNSNFYAVVIASYVTREEANTVKEQAIQNGLSPNDIYIK